MLELNFKISPLLRIFTFYSWRVQSLSCVWLFATPWLAPCQASLSITNSRSLLKLMSYGLVMPSNHLILCHPLLFPPSIFPSIRVSSNESDLHIRWPKYWSFSFNISPSNEDSGIISFTIDCLDLFAVQGTLKSLLQHNSSKASILQCSVFFIVQLSHSYIITGKPIDLTRWTCWLWLTTQKCGGEELPNIQCQGRRLRGANTAKGQGQRLRGVTPLPPAGPRSGGCALLEQPWRDITHPRLRETQVRW